MKMCYNYPFSALKKDGRMEQARSNICGILFCFNEEQIIADTLYFYLSQGIDLVVFDNNSTDSTPDIIQSFCASPARYPGKIRETLTLVTEGYEWSRILRTACEYMHAHLSHYEWIIVVDADAFYRSPVKGLSLLEFIDAAKNAGYNVLSGELYEFYPTEKDDPSIASPVERMRYYRRVEEGLHIVLKYQKIFRYHTSLDFYTMGGHIVKRDKPRVLNSVRFIYKHYPWVSFEHGLKKIFRDRKPRYVERKEHPTWHWHWMGMLPIKKDLIKDADSLRAYNEEALLMSRWLFFWIMRCPLIKWLRNAVFYLSRIKSFCGYIKYIAHAFSFGSARHTLHLFMREMRKAVIADVKNLTASPPDSSSKVKKIDNFIAKLKLLILSYRSILQQEAAVFGYPKTYHFLMTNLCNAQCIFCNQSGEKKSAGEITLEKFKLMVSNIPVQAARVFTFSGGGEPLLCRDLFGIIKFVNESFPWVDVRLRTNGLLLLQRIEELAQAKNLRLEISIHGSPQTNDAILQRQKTEDIFKAIVLLNELLARAHKRMYKVFYPCVSRLNINDMPWLIRKAAELKVDEVSVSFCRYFPSSLNNGKEKLKTADSLFFHKELYNDVIMRTKKLAKSLKVGFEHEPVFFGDFKDKPCLQPWLITVVDWDGTVYPCTGGEVWFKAEAAKGKYHFGNLLKEHLYQFWNNDSYLMIRRTCSHRNREDFIPECKNCHNALCFKGPGAEQRHILRPLFSGSAYFST